MLSVVLDQVGSWVLERHRPSLRPEGLLSFLMREGVWHHRSVYPYAGTYTAPGHAFVYSGAPPLRSGIPGNKVWDPARRRIVGVLDDGEQAVFGHAGSFSTPTFLHAETVGDVLRRVTEDRAHVVSISMKDRSAALPGGQHPDAALWYDEDARGFTTSAYYARALPDWLGAWNRAHPASGYFTEWRPLDAAALTRSGEADDAPGEGDYHGLGTRFPHRLAAAREPYAALLATPMSAEYELELARECVRRFELGRDEQPDLLALSISSTDYVGHVFGPDSWEAADDLARVDLALGRFLRELWAQGIPVAVLVTADHGVAPLPERAREHGESAERLQGEELAARVERALDAALGDHPEAPWVGAFQQPFLYLTDAAREPAVRARAVAAATQALREAPGVAFAYDVEEARAWEHETDPLRRAIALSIPSTTRGDVIVVPARHSVVDEHMPAGHGTSHGSPWEYDTEVPVLFWAPGLRRMETWDAQEQGRVAATLAALLRVPPPGHGAQQALPGAPRP